MTKSSPADVDLTSQFEHENIDVSLRIDKFGRVHSTSRQTNWLMSSADDGSLTLATDLIGDSVLITLAGAVDENTAVTLKDVLLWFTVVVPRPVLLDLSLVWLIDITGMSVIEMLTEHPFGMPSEMEILRPSVAMERLSELVADGSPMPERDVR